MLKGALQVNNQRERGSLSPDLTQRRRKGLLTLIQTILMLQNPTECDSDDEDDEGDVPTSSFVPQGNSTGNLFGYVFMSIFRHASFAKF